MSEKKARASVFFVIAIIAFICSCILFSMTGGVSDWIGDGIYDSDNETDTFGLSEFIDHSEGYSTDGSYDGSSDENSQSDDSDSGQISSKLFKKLTNTEDKDSSSSDSSFSDKSDSDKSDSSSDSSYFDNGESKINNNIKSDSDN